MITQNGRAVIGFGDTAVVAPVSNPGELAIRVALLGATAAGTLGGLIGGRKGTLIGIAVGGVGAGAIAYASLRGPTPGTPSPTPQPAPTPTPTPTPPAPAPIPTTSGWRKLSPGDPIVEGQTVAVAALLSGGAPIPSDVATSISNSFAAFSAMDARMGFSRQPHVYLPGQPLPPDWPQDDNLGPGAYRVSVISPVSDPYYPEDFTKVIPIPLEVTAWVK